MGDNLFRFNLDADISKSEKGDSGRRLIKGYASTSNEDRQNEVIVQKGLDISDFVNHGYFNYDHNNSIILGYPLPTCRVDSHGFYVEGELLKGIPEADKIWELAVALKKSGAPRKLGFSVEGKVVERDSLNKGKILKAKIYNVAITTIPVNTSCSWDAIVKSFNGELPEDEILFKSLEAGHEIDPSKMEGGEVHIKESLGESLHNLSYVIGDDEKKKKLKSDLVEKSIAGNLSKREALVYMQVTTGMSANDCLRLMQEHNF